MKQFLAWLITAMGVGSMSAGLWINFGIGYALILAGIVLAVVGVTVIDIDKVPNDGKPANENSQ